MTVKRVRLHAHDDVQIPGRATAPTGRSLAGHALGGAGLGSRWHAHGEGAFALGEPRARASLATNPRDFAGAATRSAFASGRKKAGLLPREALAVAAFARHKARRAAFGSGAATTFAVARAREVNFLFATESRFLEAELQGVAQILARGPLAAGAEEIAEDRVEKIGDRAEVGLDPERHVRRGGTETVVIGALSLVAQHGVGERDFLEFLLGGMIARIAIGMVLQGQLPVRGLDLGRWCLAIHAQDLVGIACRRSSHALGTAAG